MVPTRLARPAAILAASLLLAPGGALAAPGDQASDAAPAAEALFREGRAAFERGDYETAHRHFAESHRLEPAAGTLLNLALCEEQLGELARAWQHAQEVLDQLPATDERHAIASALAEDLNARLPRLTVVLEEGAPPGTTVLRGGVELRGSSLGMPLPIDPGRHLVVVRSPGRPPMTWSIELREGDDRILTVAPAASPPASAVAAEATSRAAKPEETTTLPADVAEPPPPRVWMTAGIVAVAVGGASVGASLVFGGLVLDRSAAVDDHCDDARRCDAIAFEAADEGRLFSSIATVTFVAGAALAAVGVGLIVLSPGPDATVRAGVGPGSAFVDLAF